MNIIGKEVTHVKYGDGTIVEVVENKMKVDFMSDTKTFVYPESFERFFSITDKKVKSYIDEKLVEISALKKMEVEQKEKEELLKIFKSNFKAKDNSHAAFDISDDEWTGFINTWSIPTGFYLTGNNKGKPRVSKNLNMNSACILTMKPKGSAEKNRIILGIFMTPSDFIGKYSTTGVIPAHEKYRILWDKELNKPLFWDYFSDEEKLNKWGSTNMKSISTKQVQKILEDMINISSDTNNKEVIKDFYQYFCQMNENPL